MFCLFCLFVSLLVCLYVLFGLVSYCLFAGLLVSLFVRLFDCNCLCIKSVCLLFSVCVCVI